jgi:hypothetical protein
MTTCNPTVGIHGGLAAANWHGFGDSISFARKTAEIRISCGKKDTPACRNAG